MNLKNRIKRIEAGINPAPPCFCGKTLADLWCGEIDAGKLIYCRNCQPQFDVWANLTVEANSVANVTDGGIK